MSLLAAGLGLVAPLGYYVQRHDRRRAELQAALAEAIGQMRDAIRTGLSVQETLGALARSGPEPLRPEFARLVREMRLAGFEPALTAMRELKLRNSARSEFVFQQPSEFPGPYEHFDGHWYAALESAGIDDLRFHDLRHTAITNDVPLVMSG